MVADTLPYCEGCTKRSSEAEPHATVQRVDGSFGEAIFG